MTKETFSKARYNNLWSKSIIVIFVLLTTLGIYWKKKRILCKIPKYQRNVLTLKQTVGLIILLYANNMLCDYLLAVFPPSEFLFILEELRVILVENLLTRFLLPILLISNTQRTFPALWAEKHWKRREFFMTKITLPETKVSLEDQEHEGRKHTALGQHNERTTTTTLANYAMGSSLTEVAD